MLIGRAGPVAELLALVDAPEDGRPRAALVRGEAGIGKTALLREVQAQLGRRGVRVLYGRADDLERGQPFRLVRELARSLEEVELDVEDERVAALRQGVAGIDAAIRTGSGTTAAQHLLSDAVVHVVEAIALRGAVVLLVDDLQWADAESAAVLDRIHRELHDVPVSLVGAARPEPLPWDLARTFEAVAETRLGPLLAEDLEELAGATVGAAPGPRLVQELGRTGGNPFLTLELLGSLRADDRLRFADGFADLAETALPDELRATVLDRVGQLGEPAARLMRLASVLGSTFDGVELEGLAGSGRAAAHLADAVRLGLLDAADPERYAFRHDLVREALYDSIPSAERPPLHAAVVGVLAGLDVPSARLASHLLRSEASDEATSDLLERTARDLQRSSAAGSLELAERCLALEAVGSPRWVRVLAGMVPPLLYLARFEDAERVARLVLEEGRAELSPDWVRELRFSLYIAVVRQDDVARAIAELDGFLEDPALRPEDEALFRIGRAQSRLQRGTSVGAAADGEFALAVGRERQDTRLLVAGWLVQAFVASLQGRTALASDHARRAADHQDDGAVVLTDLYHGLIQINADELEAARRTLNAGRARARSMGDLSSQASYDSVIAARHYAAGEWDDCLAEAEVASTRLVSGARPPHMVLAGRAMAARVHLHRGDLTAAGQEVAAGDAALAAGAVVGGDLFLWAKALLLEEEGDLAGALGLLELGFELTTESRFLVTWRATLPDLVRVAIATDRLDLIDRAVADAERGAEAAGDLPSARACALYCRGMAEDDLELMVRATAAYRRSPRPPDLARCAAATGVALARAGRAEEGAQLLQEAAGLFGDRGAVADLHPIERLLRTLDAPPERPGPRASSGWDSLTRSELKVADLVAEGMTTPDIARALFVSPNTVTTHLRHIFDKLGVRSRTAVAAETIRQRGAAGG